VTVEALSAQVRADLERYLALVYAANAQLNLTRIPRAEAWERHVGESLALLPLRTWRPGEVVLDLGSGAGLPGVPLACARPDLRVVLLEKSPKKAAFLERVVAELGLAGVTVAAVTAEAWAVASPRSAAVVVSRAAAPPRELVQLAFPLLTPGGELLAHVGASAEVDGPLRAAARRLGGGPPVIEAAGPIRVLRVRRPPPAARRP